MEGSCEYCNATFGSIKCWEFLEWLHNWSLWRKTHLHGGSYRTLGRGSIPSEAKWDLKKFTFCSHVFYVGDSSQVSCAALLTAAVSTFSFETPDDDHID